MFYFCANELPNAIKPFTMEYILSVKDVRYFRVVTGDFALQRIEHTDSIWTFFRRTMGSVAIQIVSCCYFTSCKKYIWLFRAI
mmetsp:Transcript_8999/g.32875  ORF Transcript_8999/g.32875 Transcript_8999/m.32875 type:complete len:83 (+) Transcript_8999:2298-2546(+)